MSESTAPSAAQPVGGAAPAAAVTPNVVVPVSSPAPVAAITAQPTSTVRGNFRQLLVIWRVIQGIGGASEEPAALALPAPGQLVATTTVRIAQTFDRIGDRLTRLPANPITDFLSGALLLVRRTLLPDVPTIPALTVSNVSVLEGDTGTTEAVFTVTLDKAYDTPVTVAYAATGGSSPYAAIDANDPSTWGVRPLAIRDFLRAQLDRHDLIDEIIVSPGRFSIDSPQRWVVAHFLEGMATVEDVDQRRGSATAGVDYTPVSGLLTFDPGQTSQQVSVTVLGDTTDEPTETFDLNVYATLLSRSATSAVTGVVLGQGIGTIISDDNPACVQTKDCSGADLRDRRLSGDLSKVNFNDANLTGADLTKANLSQADLTDADLTDADLTEANLTGATLTHAYLYDADLTGADLTGADLTAALLTGASLRSANLQSANLRFAILGRLAETTAGEPADLTDANLNHANLTRANLYGANLTNSDLTDAKLYGAKLLFANLTGADLTRADLRDAQLVRANLTNAILVGATLNAVAYYSLFQVTWGNTTCPDGSKTNTGCSAH